MASPQTLANLCFTGTKLELDSGFPPNKIDAIFAYYEVGFFETTQFLPELSGNFKSRDHELTA